MRRLFCTLLAALCLTGTGFAQCHGNRLPLLCACMADQITATLQTHMDRGLPIAGAPLVDLNNAGRTSSLGRTLARNLGTELALRGFLLVDQTGKDAAHQDELLGRATRATRPPQAVLTGTYAVSGDSVAITAELVRVADNLVLTTASGTLRLTEDTRAQLGSVPSVAEQTPKRLMSLRNKNDIRTIQQALAAIGLYKGRVDGIWGRRSKAALAAFRSGRGMNAQAVWDAETQNALLPAS